MSSRSTIHSRARTLALVVLFLAAQFGHWFHQANERHVRCAEHGEWVHVPASPESEALADAGCESSGAHEDHGGPAALPDGPPALGHEHCELALLDRERTHVRSSLFDVARPVGPVHDVRAPHDAPRAPAVALHRLAPKQSPPC